MKNLFEFGLDPDSNRFKNLGSGPNLDQVNGNELLHFSQRALFSQIFRLHLNLDLTFSTFFGIWLYLV